VVRRSVEDLDLDGLRAVVGERDGEGTAGAVGVPDGVAGRLREDQGDAVGDVVRHVEVASATSPPSAIHIRDSKTPEAPHLTVTPTTRSAFLGGLHE
jgi:hypothetical protein